VPYQAADVDELDRVLCLLKSFGTQSTSFQVLEPGYRYWFDGDACIAFADVKGAWVTAGEPIAPPGQQQRALRAFMEDARAVDRRVRFFHICTPFAEQSGLTRILIGEQPWWDPRQWLTTLQSAPSLREQLRRARAKGVEIQEPCTTQLEDPRSPQRQALELLLERWLRSRGMQRMRFLVRLHPFSFASERRYAMALHDGKPVGLAVAIPIFARGAWFIEDLVRDPDAPNGTVELMIDALMQRFVAENVSEVTLGLAPLSGEVSSALVMTRDITGSLYNFAGVRAFKEKLRPARWEPVYLAFPEPKNSVAVMRDVLGAFAPEGFIRFGFNTFVRKSRR
jgi:lysylphosphatidylglycerol synthetase-like protein (DUF2156 family)